MVTKIFLYPNIEVDAREFRRRPRFSPTPEIFADTRDFRRRPRFSPTPEIFADARNRRCRIGATRKKNSEKKFSGRRPENFFETATDINKVGETRIGYHVLVVTIYFERSLLLAKGV